MPNFRNLMSGDSGGAALVEVENSALFNSAASEYLSRTPSSAGNRDTWTFSAWVNTASRANGQTLFSAGSNDSNGTTLWSYSTNGALQYRHRDGGSATDNIITTPLFRDIGWYHIVFAVDTTQPVETNRVRIYVNGVAITDFSTSNYPAQNADTDVNSTVAHHIGATTAVATEVDGYIAETVLIDGLQLPPTSFGEYDTTGLYWTPKSSDDIKALTFGNNGFYQNYSDSSDVGADQNAAVTPTEGTAEFDGTNDYTILSSQLTGSADGVSGFVSLWVNMAADGVNTHIMAGTKSGGDFYVNKNTSDYIQVYLHNVPVNAVALKLVCSTTQIKAASGWQHVLISWTSGGVHHIYVNDVAQSFSTATHTSADMLGAFTSFTVGSFYNGGNRVNGSLADVIYSQNYIDISNETNRRKFITADLYPATWATAIDTVTDPLVGMHLDVGEAVANFANNADGTGQAFTINGTLTSGPDINYQGGNNFTNNNTVVTTANTMTNTVATLNPLNLVVGSGAPVLNIGNTRITSSAATGFNSGALTTIPMGAGGKYYFEVYVEGLVASAVPYGISLGISPFNLPRNFDSYTTVPGKSVYEGGSIDFQGSGYSFLQANAGAQNVNIAPYAPSVGQYLQCAFDSSNGKIWYGINNTWYGSGNPSTGANPASTLDVVTTWHGWIACYTTVAKAVTNFGTTAYQYTPPTGFGAVTTTAIAEATTRTQSNPYEYWNNILYTGNGTAIGSGGNAITGAGFQPDFGWIKGRSGATEHVLTDIVRGVTKELSSNDTGAEETVAEGLTAFGSDGFTVGSNGSYNTSSATYVAWLAKLGGAASTNEDGSIDSSVSVNQTLGMSVGTYTGNATGGATIGHGLNVTPGMVIVKNIDYGSGGWSVYHKDLNAVPEDYYIFLHTTSAAGDNASYWNDTAPTTSVFSIGSNDHVNRNTDTHMFIAFAPSQFISIGSYTGNANTNGTFVPTLNSLGVPLQPIFHLIKRSSATGSWKIIDAGRSTYNQTNAVLTPDTAAVEGTAQDDDLLSGGFKWRASDSDVNGSGTYTHLTIGTPIIDTDGRIIAGR